MTVVCAVVVTHRRPDELAKSLDVLSTQSRLPDRLIGSGLDDRTLALSPAGAQIAVWDMVPTSPPRL